MKELYLKNRVLECVTIEIGRVGSKLSEKYHIKAETLSGIGTKILKRHNAILIDPARTINLHITSLDGDEIILTARLNNNGSVASMAYQIKGGDAVIGLSFRASRTIKIVNIGVSLFSLLSLVSTTVHIASMGFGDRKIPVKGVLSSEVYPLINVLDISLLQNKHRSFKNIGDLMPQRGITWLSKVVCVESKETFMSNVVAMLKDVFVKWMSLYRKDIHK